MPLRTLRLLLTFAVLGTALAGAAGSSVSAAQRPPCGGTISDAGKGWLAMHPPFSAGPARVTQVTSPPFAPSVLFATNGAQVMRSVDAGCTWSSLAIPTSGQSVSPIAVPAPLDGILRIPATSHVTAIASPSSATASNSYVYVGLTSSSPVGDQPQVLVFSGNDNSPATAPSGLPRFGAITDLAASDTVPTTAYAVVSGGGTLGADGLYVTTDGGATWTKRAADVTGLTHLRVNPVVQTSLFAQSSRGVVNSTDGGGSSFNPPTKPSGDVASYDVASGGGYMRLVQGHRSQRVFDRSDDGGQTWATERSPVVAAQIAMQPIIDQVAVSDGHRLFLELGGDVKHAKDVTPAIGAPVHMQMTAPLATGYALVGLVHGAIVRGVFSLARMLIPAGPGLRPVLLLPHAPPHQFPATLLPGTSSLTLKPGGHQDVHYRLLLPRTPSPVDVMFLVDTTDSQEKTIDGLRQDLAGIVDDLATAGLDTRFGVAEFRDYPPQVADKGAGEKGDKPYTLRRIIGPDDASLRTALNQLQAGGGGDPAEADLTALYQSTTGAGQRWGKHNQHVIIKPGQDAHYRSDALRLAVLATDAPFHRERSYLTPSWDTTVAALRAAHVHPIGLAVQSLDDKNRPRGYRSLHHEQQLAVATGSLAPTGGVDCNGDLTPDVPAGAPFVCKVPATTTSTVGIGNVQIGTKVEPVKIAPAIVTAAESLPDLRTVSLGVAGGNGVATVVAPSPQPQVNLKNDNTVGYTVRYTCPRAKVKHTFHLGLSAGTGFRTLATAQSTLVCDPVAVKPHQHHPEVPPEAALVVPPAAAAAAPPAPGNPVPNANPNPNPVPNANVGFASQEEEQKQLAFADADFGAGDTTELAMSRPSSSDGEVQLWLGGAALLLTAAAGYAARTRVAAAWHQS